MVQLPTPAALPEPTPDELALTTALTMLIRAEITHAGNSIPFSRFMDLALYAPGLGYYSAGKQKLGAHGDFITAPELGPVFARCLARQCAQVLAATGGDILEAGAGSGALAVELLLELEQLRQLPERYLIVELSRDLRERQRAALTQQAPHLAARVTWCDTLPPRELRGIVLANELLDAMPVARFRTSRGGAVNELYVSWQENRFVWCEAGASDALLRRVLPLTLPEDYESEVGFAAEGWVRSIGDALVHGVVLLIDYGFPRAEFYHPQRSRGTLMCHYRHRAHGDPLILAGLQDITAHVDFTAMAEAGRDAGLALLGYTSQALFLLGSGLEDVAARAATQDVRSQMTFTNEIKKLTLPHEMGELFKVIALGRNFDQPLTGFRMQDRRTRL
jgi:SAM-dependent MidA family methyltransferase